MSAQLPAGWYTDESGARKYWTGTEWIVPDSPASVVTNATADGESDQDDVTGLEVGSVGEETTSFSNVPTPLVSSAVSPRRSKKNAIIAGVLAGVLALGGGAWYLVDSNQKAEAARIAAEEKAAEEKAAEEQEVLEKEAEEARVRAEAEQAALKEAQRLEAVAEGEEGLKDLAMDYAKKGLKSGYVSEKVIRIDCQPVAGAGSNELGVTATTYSCLGITKDNKDGSSTGLPMEGQIDWMAGQYQIGWDF